MRAWSLWLVAASVSAAALDIPEVPKTAAVEAQSCDIVARDQGEVRRSTFEGQRTTWTEGDVTFTLSKGERVASDGTSRHLETKMRRRDEPADELTRETSEQVTVVTQPNGATSTELHRQVDLVRVTDGRRELVKRVIDGVAQDHANEVVTLTSGGPGRRVTDTHTIQADGLDLHFVCTFTAPSS